MRPIEIIAALGLTFASSVAQGETLVPPAGDITAKAWNRYHDYPELVELMQAMQKRWPDNIQLTSLGKSHQGRTLWLMTVHDPKTGPAESKPAMYVDGNIHGNEIQGAEAALYTAWYLLKNAPSVPKLASLLSRVTLYVVPTVNPDGRAYWFARANTASSSRGGQIPTDNDGDGDYDEDGPDDLDGDGNICRMRKKVPGQGNYKLDPDDPRILVPVKPGEKGDWIELGSEGFDNDDDGRVNEDGPGGYDPNRDWGSDWQPEWIQYGARPYPFNLPESQAVRDFFVTHANVAGVQAFHNMGGMILRGPGRKGAEIPAADIPVYDVMGKHGEKLLPHYRYMILWRDLYPVHGGFIDWTYLGLGIITFSNELWTAKRLQPAAESMPQKDRLAWEDEQGFGSHFVAWHPFEHPTYGAIEIGGFTKDTGRLPPSFLIEEMLHRNAAFVLYQAGELPELVLDDTRLAPAGDGLTYVTVTIRNPRVTPTRTAQAASKKIGRPDLLLAEPFGVRILAAARPRDRFRPNQVDFLPRETVPTRIPIEAGVPSRGKLEICYLVSGKGRIQFRYQAEKAKDLDFEATIRR